MYKRALGAHAEWLKLQDDDGKVEGDPEHLGDKVSNQYLKAMTGMRGKLASSLSKYDLQALVTGIILLWIVSIITLNIQIDRGRRALPEVPEPRFPPSTRIPSGVVWRQQSCSLWGQALEWPRCANPQHSVPWPFQEGTQNCYVVTDFKCIRATKSCCIFALYKLYLYCIELYLYCIVLY